MRRADAEATTPLGQLDPDPARLHPCTRRPCGNLAGPMAQVIVSAAQGMTTAAQINADLVAEAFRPRG